MIFSKLLLINTLQRLEAQTLGHYWSGTYIELYREAGLGCSPLSPRK